ncbi:unnamed protein product [Orchesella dallaii]|uniref:Ionotropic glutamate receptor C-terminal domain-containing protein n=1 Tax=Orchesella dallaii TaxID=48710 RepID=A0ABP1QJ80_9HEXA
MQKSVNLELAAIIQDYFPSCSLLLIVLSGDPTPPTAQLNFPINIESLQQEKYIIELEGDLSNANKSYHDTVDVHKHRDKCTYALISLVGFENEPNRNLVNLYSFVKCLDGLIKSDEDYFIFYVEERFNLDWLLISEPFALGIKYKVVISSGDKTYKTTCFYCNMGQPSIYKRKIPFGRVKQNIAILFPDLLKDFHGKTISVSTATLSTSVTELQKTGPRTWKNIRGIFGTAVEHVSAKYNFSCKFSPSIGGGGTGLKLENGTWVGAVGDVISGRADIGNAVARIYIRNLHVGYTFPVCYAWLTFTTGLPQRRYSWKAIYWPFTPMMWLCIFLTVVLSYFTNSILLTLTGQEIPKATQILYILQILMLQGTPNPEKRPLSSIRTFIAFWLLFAFLISSIYQSKLVSTLAFPIKSELPKTFKELASTSHTFGILLHYARGAAYSMFKTNTNPDIHRIFKRMELEENDVKCFQRVIGTTAACVSWNTAVKFALHQNLSDNFGQAQLITAPDTTGFISAAFILKKRALFRLKFDKVLFWAMDMGLADEWWRIDYRFLKRRRRLWEQGANEKKVSDSGKQTEIENLSMKHLIGTFYLLMFGLLAALTCFVVEKVWDLRSNTSAKIGIANANRVVS